jgi:predicted dehydrogenase
VNVAIIGCGQIGRKRLKALRPEDRLVATVDPIIERARDLASGQKDATATVHWQTVVTQPDIDAVIISTTNDSLAQISLAAVQAGKHILVEKPAARCAQELRPVLDLATRNDLCAWVGFNLRYHPAIRKAHEMAASGNLGPLMYIRARYGHGGRPGYDREWRANPEVSGGGELLDQGVHLIDLTRWFLGDCELVSGIAGTFFWNMPVDDNAFLLLRAQGGQVASLNASCTQWKNLFSFEVFGKKGAVLVDGLGGSYGTERLTYHKVKPEMGSPETTELEFVGSDSSWQEEFHDFTRATQDKNVVRTSLSNALAALEIVDQVYQRNNDS